MNRSLIVKIVGIALIVWVIVVNVKFFFNKINNNTEDIDMALNLSPDQQIDNNMSEYVKTKYPDYKKRGVYFHASYFSIPFDVDPTAPGNNPMYAINGFPKGSLYVWDNWFSVVEGGMTFENLCKDTIGWKRDTLMKINTKPSGALIEAALFIRK